MTDLFRMQFFVMDDLRPFFSTLKKRIPSLREETFFFERFSNQELHLTLKHLIEAQPCAAVGTIHPPDTNLFAFLVLCHTLKKEGAHRVIAILPYLGYARHDKDEEHKSRITSLIANVLQAAGIDQVITFDVHSSLAAHLFSIPLTSISTAQLFAGIIRKEKLKDFTLVAPDMGAIHRVRDVARHLDFDGHIAHIDKKRTADGVVHFSVHGEIQREAIIIDDILDTGKTLISSCRLLKEKGCHRIVIMVTHGLFTGEVWKQLWSIGVEKIYCTDTMPLADCVQLDERVEVISVASLLEQALKEY
ncbi:MAG: ribose-phosphate diphosphokinase [Simkaniaceae bacterium]|nr:ribose-phosphate diphosphokinase [Simkaniaceae bacterium]MCF7852087.1 ribose-phosphate diphosphokinase [Simkaniaceae bacterium]